MRAMRSLHPIVASLSVALSVALAACLPLATAAANGYWDRRPLPDDSVVKLVSVSKTADQAFRGGPRRQVPARR